MNIQPKICNRIHLSKDVDYGIRKKRLHTLREDIKMGKEVTYDFDTSVDELIKELNT